MTGDGRAQPEHFERRITGFAAGNDVEVPMELRAVSEDGPPIDPADVEDMVFTVATQDGSRRFTKRQSEGGEGCYVLDSSQSIWQGLLTHAESALLGPGEHPFEFWAIMRPNSRHRTVSMGRIALAQPA